MTPDIWELIVNINNVLQPLREADSVAALRMIDLLEARSKLRAQLEGLRLAVSERYSERDAYFVLFPLMAHCDEMVKMRIPVSQQVDWPPLQQELYQVADAGDLFYELLDKALSKPETLALVYEVYFFCLQDGFCGRYSADPDRINEYRQKLRKLIPIPPVTAEVSPESNPLGGVWFRIPNYAYYLGVAVLLLGFYVFLTDLASSWQPS